MAKNIKELTVKWIMVDEKIIRFVEMSEANEMIDNVANLDFEKAGIVKGAKVNVELNADNKVIFLTLVKGIESPKQEEKIQDKPIETKESLPTNTKVLTVGGLSPKYRGITFKEEKDVWYDVVNEIGIENLEKMGIVRGSTVEVTIGEPEGKSKNKRVVGIKLAEKKEVSQENKTPNNTNDFDREKSDIKHAPKDDKDAFYIIKRLENQIEYLQNEKTSSIEANSAVERAYSLVGAMVQNETGEANVKNKEVIKGLIKEFALDAYNLIQELKQKKS